MHKSIQLIYFLRFFGTGIILPVLSLILLSRGATIETVSLIIGFYSVTVIAAEFPSGVFADLYGRKNAFLLSCALSLVSYCVFLFSRSAGILMLGMLANGLSRAFSSGSLEALMIDQAGETQIPLAQVTARISVLESAGIASGALIGGLLAQIGTRYSANLGVNVLLCALLLLLTARFVQEAPRKTHNAQTVSHRQMFIAQVKDSLRFAKQKGIVRILLLFCLLMGFSLNSIEIYWQPALASFHSESWMFGAVSFAGFGFVMLGSLLSERLLRRNSRLTLPLLFLLKGVLGLGLAVFCFANSAFSIIGCYLGLYLLIGGSGVVESTLLNLRTPGSHRASILSLFSLVLQIGGVIASLTGYFVSTYSKFQNMWLLGGILLFSFSAAVGLFYNSLRGNDACCMPEEAAAPPEK